jgi:hypothetical protein
MAAMIRPQNLREEPARFFSTLTSLNNLDKLEIRHIIRGLLNPTQREVCFTANYYRVLAHVESILALNHVKNIQGIASAARGLVEIAVDVALIDQVSRGPEKMLALIDVEKMRSAQAIIDFNAANPTVQVDDYNFSRVHQIGRRPHYCNARFLMARPARCPALVPAQTLGQPFNAIYAVEYPAPQLVHSLRPYWVCESVERVVRTHGRNRFHHRSEVLHGAHDRNHR